jgi:hypothetical protein
MLVARPEMVSATSGWHLHEGLSSGLLVVLDSSDWSRNWPSFGLFGGPVSRESAGRAEWVLFGLVMAEYLLEPGGLIPPGEMFPGLQVWVAGLLVWWQLLVVPAW